MTPVRFFVVSLSASLFLAFAACNDDGRSRDAAPPGWFDGGHDAPAPGDAGGTDSGTMDGAIADSGAMDSGSADSGPTDSGTTDAAVTDATIDDSGTDTGAADASIPLGCADHHLPLDTLLMGDTTTATEDYNLSGSDCARPSVTGGDVVYRLAPTAGAGTYQVEVTPTANWSPMIQVLDRCDATACITGTNFNGAGDRDSISLELTEPVYVVVDSDFLRGDGEGPYTIRATFVD